MSDTVIEVPCTRCGHRWYVDLSSLKEMRAVVYRGEVCQRTYSVRCPQCGTHNVVTVEFEEEQDG